MEEFCRTERLLGAATVEKLSQSRVAVFGIGGVGGHAAEALVRSGIGALDIVDGDEVALSNINRQIIALHSTVGMPKTEAAAERFLDINPNLRLKKFQLRLSEETAGEFDFSAYDYVIDAIDDIRAIVDDRNEKIGRKIRDNELKRIPYLLIVGENEMNNNIVSVRKQGEGVVGEKTPKEFADMVNDIIKSMMSEF